MREPTEMELRVAEAILSTLAAPGTARITNALSLLTEKNRSRVLEQARAAIRAMREPTEDILAAGCFKDTGNLYWKRGFEEDMDGLNDCHPSRAYKAFTKRSFIAMIDAASPVE